MTYGIFWGVTKLTRMLEDHLEELKWSQKTLAERLGIDPALVCKWIKGRQDIHPKQINRLAVVIAQGYDEQHREDRGMNCLDGLLNELLMAAGRSAAITGRNPNSVWARLSTSTRQLRVGWVLYPPFCNEQRSPIAAGPVGVSVDVMMRVAELLGAELDWKLYDWGTILPALIHREIDIICPILLVLPTRMFQIRFSDILPELSIGVNGVVHKQYYSRVFLNHGQELNTNAIVVTYVQGEAGQDLCTMFAPRAHLDQHPHTSAAEACAMVFNEPLDDRQRVRCFVADHTICVNRYRKNQQDLALVYQTYPVDKPRLQIAAGIHPEEDKLVEIINSCLKILQATGYFPRLYKRYEADLTELDVWRPAKHLRTTTS